MPIEFKIRNLTVIDLNCLFDSALFEANKYALDNDIKSSKDISTLFKHFTFTKFLDVAKILLLKIFFSILKINPICQRIIFLF